MMLKKKIYKGEKEMALFYLPISGDYETIASIISFDIDEIQLWKGLSLLGLIIKLYRKNNEIARLYINDLKQAKLRLLFA